MDLLKSIDCAQRAVTRHAVVCDDCTLASVRCEAGVELVTKLAYAHLVSCVSLDRALQAA